MNITVHTNWVLYYLEVFYLYFILSLRNEIIFLRFNQVPRRSKWEVAGKMRVARYGMAAIPLQNSYFMVIGGQSNKTTGFSLTYQWLALVIKIDLSIRVSW